ncbi:hypothetical protein KM92CIT3_80965 [uncultured Citrobacter sp.]|uniref:Uncharacterized protein n=1 Tax=uncultured Citrobacter sp. TaxID=200446 RepID=A0A212I293_9ENTR|nr:hypothetical protein KL86CIT2_10004 [uncultured Citrobacter sp.]SBV68583.1 hypothetical protein KM92CIT3_80965 [uncultured Citrobacter sp.]
MVCFYNYKYMLIKLLFVTQIIFNQYFMYI